MNEGHTDKRACVCGYVNRKCLPISNKQIKKKISVIWCWNFLWIITVANTEISETPTFVILARKKTLIIRKIPNVVQKAV